MGARTYIHIYARYIISTGNRCHVYTFFIQLFGKPGLCKYQRGHLGPVILHRPNQLFSISVTYHFGCCRFSRGPKNTTRLHRTKLEVEKKVEMGRVRRVSSKHRKG